MTFYLEIANKIASRVSARLIEHLTKNGYQGIQSEEPEKSKATHKVDKIAADEILDTLQGVSCQLFLESFQQVSVENPDFSIFIDPVDGSVNWDLGIGDPATCIAFCSAKSEVTFNEIEFVYVQGLRSGDVYFFDKNSDEAWYKNFLTNRKWPIKKTEPVALRQAMGYLKTGYGGAAKQLNKTLPLFNQCKDIRSIDNSAMEFAELSRAATDFIVDARDLSDSFNLLTYPLVKHAGGVITDLSGKDIGEYCIVPEKVINYIAAGSKTLHEEIMNAMVL